MKRYAALARVSSREQEREGFSLDVQVDAFNEYAKKNRGTLVNLIRIAETASKSEERKKFRRLIAYVERHHQELDGILFYKIDRAARNLRDLVLLEELEEIWSRNNLGHAAYTEHAHRPNGTAATGDHGSVLHGAAIG